jgi:hypothetical protein
MERRKFTREFKLEAVDLLPVMPPFRVRVCSGFDLRPIFGPPDVRVFRLHHDGGLGSPPGFCNVIGTLYPIAP